LDGDQPVLLYYIDPGYAMEQFAGKTKCRNKIYILLHSTLAINHTKHPGEQRVSSYPFPNKKLRGSNRQDFIFIRPPGIAHEAFELRMDNVWYCKILLLFETESRTDDGMKRM
jgi:hypothetical protein